MTAPSLFADGDSAEDSDAPEPAATGPIAVSSPHLGSSSLYRKYRPQSFAVDDLVGQDHVVRTLRNAILLDRVSHAYLFSGPRGTGKTTTARLLAKAINCLDPDPGQRPCNRCQNCLAINAGAAPDIIEIDAASNRGIDDIRDLRERVRYAPAHLPSKVYIIDEAHQITGAAANAFLKTLEEPPSHTRFILATTDPEELLPTIVSRCQHFEFRRVGSEDMMRRLRLVVGEEGIAVDPDALRSIARHATGSLRDALGLLDQLALQQARPDSDESSVITAASVQTALGLSRNERIEELVEAMARRQPGAALRVIQDAIDAGEDPRQLNKQLLAYLRLLLYERSGGATEADERARALASEFTLEQLAAHARRFSEIDFTIKHAPYPQLPLEVALVEATAEEPASTDTAPASSPHLNGPSEPPISARQSSLRDRVRNPAAARDLPAEQRLSVVQPPPAPITPIRPAPLETAPAPPNRSSAAGVTVERIADLWPQVRAEVKALNRRVEALLSEVDPVAIAENEITLAVPYPFHRDKLNTDDVRDTIGGVLTRLLGANYSVSCILRGEMTRRSTDPPRLATAAPASPDAPAQPISSEKDEQALARLQAAKNIFDAEEIEPLSSPES